MLVTLSGIVMLVKEQQPIKAYIPILVTLLGIITLVKEVQSRNAYFPMVVTLAPNLTDCIELGIEYHGYSVPESKS